VSFESREKRRKAKAAIARNKRGHATEIARRWYLTIVRRKTRCATCGGVLFAGRPMVYRHQPRKSLCLPCADAAGIDYRPSQRWEKSARRGRG
jgi:hypothetical protein